jgi:carbohydrate binding protein with CBM4/9 domain
MPKLTIKRLILFCSCLALCFASHATANLVTNGGFETGDLTGWTQSGNTGNTGVNTSNPYTGSYSAFAGPAGTYGFLSQTLATTPGSLYDLDFWLTKPREGSPTAWRATLDGVGVEVLGGPKFDWTHFTFPGFLATTGATTLEFGFINDPGFFYLDDVSVNASARVPESFPTIWLALPVVAMFGLLRLRNRTMAIL